MKRKGMVYLVGAGPGDAELLTLKGERLLKGCEVVIYDRLASENLLQLVPKDCEKINVGKVVGSHSWKQEDINRVIVKKGLEGKRVVRLKGGDPFVFGRGGEEILSLQEAGIAFEVVPGITSSVAAAAMAGIPVTHRGVSRSFHVITGHTKEGILTDNFETLAKLEGTLVFLMGMGHIEQITDELMKHGKAADTPAAVVSNGTTFKQREVRGTVKNIAGLVKQEDIKAPAVIIIGGVAELAMKGASAGSLSGVRIGVTGTDKFTKKLSGCLKEEGAFIDHLSYLRIEDYCESKAVIKAIGELAAYSWLVFTSTNGVELFFKAVKEQKVDYRILAHSRFAVVGKGTGESLLKEGFQADYVPNCYTTRALGEGLLEILRPGEKVLLPRAAKGSAELTEFFDNKGISYTDLTLYDVVPDMDILENVYDNLPDYDYLTFASASGVEVFFQNMREQEKENLNRITLVCIGDITGKKLKEYGMYQFLTAEEYTAAGLVECMIKDREKRHALR
jgi:uroporphyrinogen III methyltransferase/synthase